MVLFRYMYVVLTSGVNRPLSLQGLLFLSGSMTVTIFRILKLLWAIWAGDHQENGMNEETGLWRYFAITRFLSMAGSLPNKSKAYANRLHFFLDSFLIDFNSMIWINRGEEKANH